jgi:hypothetical protein
MVIKDKGQVDRGVKSYHVIVRVTFHPSSFFMLVARFILLFPSLTTNICCCWFGKEGRIGLKGHTRSFCVKYSRLSKAALHGLCHEDLPLTTTVCVVSG